MKAPELIARIQDLVAAIPVYYVITANANDGSLLLWNGNWHVLETPDKNKDYFEGKPSELYAHRYLNEADAIQHFDTLKKRKADFWAESLFDYEFESQKVVALKRTICLHAVHARSALVKSF